MMWKSIETGLIRFLLLVDSVIYNLVATLFSIFVDLANVEVFSESVISSFSQRIYVIAGVIALFIVTYSLLNSVVNPDNLSKGNNSGAKIFMNLVTSIVLVALVPAIFNFAYSAQNAILGDDIIGKIFLGTSEKRITVTDQDTGEEIDIGSSYIVKQKGAMLSWNVLNAFLYKSNGAIGDEIVAEWSPVAGYAALSDGISSTVGVYSCGGAIILTIGSLIATYFTGGGLWATIPATGKTMLVTCGLTVANNVASDVAYNLTDSKMSWNELLLVVNMGDFTPITAFAEIISEGEGVEYMPMISTIAGCVLLWMVFSFCLDLGLRAVKLAFYHMIAPIPIFARILPNNKIFNNWIKVTITTFLEVFVRLIILYSVIFFASNISEINLPGGGITKAIVILGLITFARQLPKLLAEVTGIDSGNMKMGIMEKLGAGGLLAAGALIGGAVSAGVKNFSNSWRNNKGKGIGRFTSAFGSGLSGAVSGGFRSARGAGFKAKSFGDMTGAISSGAKAAHSKSKGRQAYRASHGGTTMGVLKGHMADAWTGVQNWAGVHGDILDVVQYEDDYMASFDDYATIYENGAYKAMDAQLNQIEARIAAEGDTAETYAGSGITLATAKGQLKTQMRYQRLKAISDNVDGTAYAALNIARQVKKDPNTAARAGVSADFIRNADDFVLKNNKVYHRNGSAWTAAELHQLFEGKTVTSVDAHGNVTGDRDDRLYSPTFEGLGSTKKAVGKRRKQDKNSIDYKEAKKAEDKSSK